ncbi:lipid II flippase MurJ [Gemmatimonas sp.]|uniref:murein biosynthesis integral membrane protein MurJ n=1 Tax=Gemmatimonas sp. TaxID=1962908 RepID=UPI00286A718E|nr:lipid II flippase MurJ [Gemmatimonas sp.]
MRGLLRAALAVGGLTAAVKLVALLKDSLVAAQFGNGAALDAFLLALVVPTFLISVAAGTLPAALTPAYIAQREHRSSASAKLLAGAVLRQSYRWLVVLSGVAALASGLLGWLPGARLDADTRHMLPLLAFVLAPFTLLQGVCAAWSGLLAAEGAYRASAFAPIAQPLGIALGIAFVPDPTVWTMVAGLLAGTLAQAAWLAWSLRVHGLSIRGVAMCRVPHDERAALSTALARVRVQYLPAVAGAILMSATTLVDQTMAAWLPVGSVSALGYGTKLSSVLMTVGAMALSTTLLPHLSALVARAEWTALRELERRLRWLLLGTTIPVTIALMFFSVPIVQLLFERGAFSAVETATVSRVQAAYLLQVPGHLLGILYVRLISALQANRLLTIGAAINLVVNIALNVVFMRRYGVAGIALSTAAVYAVSCAYLAVVAHRRLRAAEAESIRVVQPDSGSPLTRIAEASCASAA